MLDFSTLTGHEVSLIEDLSGMPLDSIGNADAPKAKLLGALVLIAKRREGDTKYTFNQAMGLTITEMTEFLGLNEEVEEDSEEGKDEPSEKPAPRAKRRSSSISE